MLFYIIPGDFKGKYNLAELLVKVNVVLDINFLCLKIGKDIAETSVLRLRVLHDTNAYSYRS